METQNAEKLSITLPAEMVRVIRERVSSGDYGSTSEVVREAMRGWLQRERRLAALDAAIARGVSEADAGFPSPGGLAKVSTLRLAGCTRSPLRPPTRR